MALTRSFLLLACFCAFPRQLWADLRGDAGLLEAEWRGFANVSRLRPRWVERGQVQPLLPLPDPPPASSNDCTTVAVLSPPSSSFAIRFFPGSGASPEAAQDEMQKSRAGAVQVTRCGAQRQSLNRMMVDMRSPRALVEVVVATAAEPMPSLTLPLPHRAPGPTPAPVDVGEEPAAPETERLAQLISKRARLAGATPHSPLFVDGSAGGSAAAALQLAPGCHEFFVSSSPNGSTRAPSADLDGELVLLPDESVVDTDRAESKSASLRACLADAAPAELRITGLRLGERADIAHNVFRFPDGIPVSWGPLARSALAGALVRSRLRTPPHPPAVATLGITGVTSVPQALIPGACYQAAVAVLRGTPVGLSLSVTVGLRTGRNSAGAKPNGAALAFCAGPSDSGQLDIAVEGRGVVWLLAVWRNGQLPLGDWAE